MEVEVKLTRLRRRLSVESEDTKSPSSQSTPTKKKGGKLAAKPQLELIEENENQTTKRTRRSTVRDITEPSEEKAVTPSRRSARIRSNTSLISETASLDVPEDKGTPSRRTTRIKSNTSIVSETAQTYESPRAKRAARRLSQVGSDNEATVTPARQTRRTRKDSASSVDKVESNTSKIGPQIKEAIEEESENNVNQNKTPKKDSPVRKSPRLVEKTGIMNSPLDSENKENLPQTEKEASEITHDANFSQSKTMEHKTSKEKHNISATTSELIETLASESKTISSIVNKSTTELELCIKKTKRNRAKSWTTVSASPSNDINVSSDTEVYKKKNKKNNKSLDASLITGCGDGLLNTSTKKSDIKKHKNISEDNKKQDKSVSEEILKDNINETEIFFEKSPVGVIQSQLYIEDSDSNSACNDKGNHEKHLDSGDQCVPIVNTHLEEPPKTANLSYEPMDIDETITGDVSTIFPSKDESLNNNDFNDSLKEISNKSRRKSSINIDHAHTTDDVFNISQNKRKSIVTDTKPDNVNDDKNESKLADADKSYNSKLNSKSKNAKDQSIIEDSNKSKRKSSISDAINESILNRSRNESITLEVEGTNPKPKTLLNVSCLLNTETDNTSNKSSIENYESINNNLNKSKRKTSISTPNDVSMNKTNNKSKRNSSISYEVETQNSMANDNSIDKIVNKSKRKSSMSQVETQNSTANDDPINNTINKSKRKSSISQVEPQTSMTNDNSTNISVNKSKGNSSISHETETQNSTTNENKSTLVLSQIKDDSVNDTSMEINIQKDSECNEQLSKSVNIPAESKTNDTNKNNLSLTYSTSTPLQQKSLKKLGMINTSIITPNSTGKAGKKDPITKNRNASILSQESDSSDNEEEESGSESEETCKNQSKMIDDEADEASDDYDSGDSRDAGEREYEEQNKIPEKGETLDSDEDDYTDDSDYEKDSFIVSSDAEDDDLLDGTGDDLSMSDKELGMSIKSKKKYDERKKKEQKKASREMYEARHQINSSDKNEKLVKCSTKNRNPFESSESESEEVATKSKTNRRRRIDSSQDISAVMSDADISKKKKKTKRLSESVCEDNATNEKEITVNQDVTDNIDPLDVKNIVKQEPKTPQKNLDMSTVAITNIEEVEEVDVNENLSMVKNNQTKDPLQDTLVNESDSEDSISENEEITQNYESMLKDLNKSKSKKIKSSDISLNLDKKSKKKSKEPIVDQLNLTQVKKSKKEKALSENQSHSEKSNINPEKGNKSVIIQDEDSSNSIDMHLLFPEDSNDSEAAKAEDTKKSHNNDNQAVVESFIPLKKSDAKTNLLETTDDTSVQPKRESTPNSSKKQKKNKRKSSIMEETTAAEYQPNEEPCFFIDTTGALTDINKTDLNTSAKSSAKKNKQKKHTTLPDVMQTMDDENSNDAPLEIPYQSNKNNKDLNETHNTDEAQNDNTDTDKQTQSAKKKKKKKNKKELDTSNNKGKVQNEVEPPVAHRHNISVTNTKTQNQMIVTDTINTGKTDEISPEKSKKRKRNQTLDIGSTDEAKSSTLITNEKKKRKILPNDEEAIGHEVPITVNADMKQVEIKKITKSQSQVFVGDDVKPNKKRKERDDDEGENISKVSKQHSFDKVHVPRLPDTVLKQLEPKDPNKQKIVSTTSFVVEETRKRRNKPSNYLEQSVYLNDSEDNKKQKSILKKPKVLPFLPTVSTSDQGFTTKFQVNVIPQKTQFIAQSNETTNFKNDFLKNQRIKKLGTFEMYKRQRNIKISKF